MINEKIEKLNELTIKKLEAFEYILGLLIGIVENSNLDEISNYYKKKQKVEKAILKVDIEFVDTYNALLNLTMNSNLRDLPAAEYPLLKSLKKNVKKVSEIEAEIVLREEQLLSKMSPRSKRPDQRSIEAYKKFKK